MSLIKDNGETVQMFEEYGVGRQVALSNVSAQSPALTSTFVEIWSNSQIFYAVGVNPVADTVNCPSIPAGFVKTLRVHKGNKIAAILASGADTLYINELS